MIMRHPRASLHLFRCHLPIHSNHKNQLTIPYLLSRPIKLSTLEPSAASTKLYKSLNASVPYFTFPSYPGKRKYPTKNCSGWSGRNYTGLHAQQGEPDRNALWREMDRTKTWKKNLRPKTGMQTTETTALIVSKETNKTLFEFEIKDVTIEVRNTTEERLVLQIRDNIEIYESNGQLTFKERA